MRNTLYKLSLILSLMVFGLFACDQPLNTINEKKTDKVVPENGTVIEGQYIVIYDYPKNAKVIPGAVQHRTATLMNEYQIKKNDVEYKYSYSVKGFAVELSEDQLAKLKKDPRIKYIEKDRIITLAPPGACEPWPGCRDDGGDGGGGSGEVTPYGITRVGGPTSSNGTAWIIDTGIDLDHPDLNVDVERSAEFVSRGPGSNTVDDGNGHGTHVSGTIAAIDNDIDVVGVAAGATVVAVKVLNDRGSGTYSGVIAGVDYVAANASPGDVANMSLGGPTSDALDDAVRNAADQGIYFAIAAGNSSEHAGNSSPARVDHTNVWTVSAIDKNDVFASFSNFGNPPIDYAAPGVDVLSLWLDGGTNTISGTSMASPHVAGVLLVTNGNPNSDGTAIDDPDGNPDPIVHN